MNLIKPFLRNKGKFNHQDMMIFNVKKIRTNETELVEVFNNPFVPNATFSTPCRPVRILSTFYKVFGKDIKTYSMKTMDNFFSFLFSQPVFRSWNGFNGFV